jgi:hypothetical protein
MSPCSRREFPSLIASCALASCGSTVEDVCVVDVAKPFCFLKIGIGTRIVRAMYDQRAALKLEITFRDPGTSLDGGKS